MDLKYGDLVTSTQFLHGKYLGKETINQGIFYKIFNADKKVVLYIREGQEDQFRKLPSVKTVKRNLKIFKSSELIDSDEQDGSRYKYFKEKLGEANFQGMLEVFHDLSVLQVNKSITSSERKLLGNLETKVIDELAIVLGEEHDDVRDLVKVPA